MRKKTMVELSHQILLSQINKSSILVDATLGNGYDSLFLAPLVKEIHAFDIQKEAIDASKVLLKDYSNIKYYLKSHVYITDMIPDYNGVLFNLGYLPKSDKKIKTHYETTLLAIDKLNQNQKGFILVVAYPGHDEGLMEYVALQSYLDKKEISYEVHKLPHITLKDAPVIFFWKYTS